MMAKVNTLSELLRPLMDGVSIRAPYCVVCGKNHPLNQHHIVRRGAGKFYRGGIEVPKPTLTLCGMGNTSGCHGLAHQNKLHFRWVRASVKYNLKQTRSLGSGHWEYLITEEPTKYQKALEMDGWKPLKTF